MDSENQVIIDFGSRKKREKDKNKILICNKILYIFIFLGIIFFIYINKEIADNSQIKQIKNDFLQNKTRAKIINLKGKINLLENKIDNLITKLNEYNLTNKEFESQNKSDQNINNK